MNVDTYQHLLAELCREIGLEAAQLRDDGRLLVDGIEIGLCPHSNAEGDHLWICVDLGAIPDLHAYRVHRAMLEANLRGGGLEAGVFLLHATGRAALMVRRRLSSALTGQSLAEALSQYAAAAKCWRAQTSGWAA